MVLFGKREVVFKTTGDKARWKEARAALKSAGIRVMEAGSMESELPICSCGAKIDRRNYGPNGWIDRRVYYLCVRPKDVGQANAVLVSSVGTPLISDELVVRGKKLPRFTAVTEN